ncbi:DUF3299 domain-containing protein [Aeromonas hydrophila]|uniref:DUF3299 domain-containing protein n=1 Tax=Aeromonas hydrophila TaxID=644 RepID=UPI00249EBCAC|nr:DUF3299 domain-containing protein [Aeromonas hydrophila]WGY33015.1 DUF3299 domain-containing protein [Aeromonas hydrophila]HDC4322694.1 DUF3299 domain-containing protein [Aeromonas hydrophila]
MMKWKIVALLAALLALPAMAVEYKTIDWDVLIPAGEKLLPPPQVSHDGNLASVPQTVGGVNQKLDNQKVRIPGFVVPLEGDAKKITAFLLVPYFGACIHVPPPPTNQVVYVSYPKGAPVDDLWDAIWVKGKMRTVSSSHEMATASYSMEAVEVSVYEEQ